jgi:hypothetical protein
VIGVAAQSRRASRDVDLIVEWDQLRAIPEHARVERSAARHAGATKWVSEWDGVHLDLYFPFQPPSLPASQQAGGSHDPGPPARRLEHQDPTEHILRQAGLRA